MPHDIPALLADVRDEIKSLRAALANATVANPGGISRKMEALMGALKDLPESEARTVLPALEALYGDLGQLGLDFGQQADAARAGLGHLSTLSRANTAYARQGAKTGRREE